MRRLDPLRAHGLARVRLLYLYPSEVKDPLVSTMLELESVVPYFDLSLQHAAPGLLRSMKRWGSGERFTEIIAGIRAEAPEAAFRSSFIVGFPGETEADHESLLGFPRRCPARLGRILLVLPRGRHRRRHMSGEIAESLVHERLRECSEVQEPITAAARTALVGREIDVLVDGVDDDDVIVGRTHREAPEIDGVVRLVGTGDMFARPGAIVRATVCGVEGPDLDAKVLP